MAQNAFLIDNILSEFKEMSKFLRDMRETIESDLYKTNDKYLERNDSIENLIRQGGPLSKSLRVDLINEIFQKIAEMD